MSARRMDQQSPGILQRALDALGGALDSLVGVFSPRAELGRRFVRERLRSVRSTTGGMYAAARVTRLTGAWSPVDPNVNDVIGASSSMVRARVRQLVRDFPYFKRAVQVITDFVVGQGIMLQAKVQWPDGTLNEILNQQIEDAFLRFAEEADISGRMDFFEMQRLAKYQDLECGEFILVWERVREPGRFLPVALRMYEADWLSDFGAVPRGNNKIEQGVEYDPYTGRVRAYHFTDPDSFGSTVRVPAERVVHGFETLRPGQLRGISPFTSGLLLAHDLQDFMDARLDTEKLAAKYLAIVKTPDPFSRQQGVGAEEDDDGKKIEELENAIIEYLRPGEEIEIAPHPGPGKDFDPFVRFILTMLSVATGVPYELLSCDYRGLNYSVSRSSRNDYAAQLRPLAARHIRHFCMPVYRIFLEHAVLAGKLDLPGYFSDPSRYGRCEWQPPGMESVDPLRESKARINEIQAGLRSPQEIVKSRGRDLGDVYQEIATAKAMAEELGLTFEEVSLALANNPDAVIEQE